MYRTLFLMHTERTPFYGRLVEPSPTGRINSKKQAPSLRPLKPSKALYITLLKRLETLNAKPLTELLVNRETSSGGARVARA